MDCLANNENIILSFKYSIKDKKHSIEHIFKTKDNNKKIIKTYLKNLKSYQSLLGKSYRIDLNNPDTKQYLFLNLELI